MTFNSSNLTISKTKLSIHKEATVISEKARVISGQLEIIDADLYEGHSTMTNYVYINTCIDKMVNVLVTYDAFYFLDDFFGEDTNTGQLPNLSKILKIWKGEINHCSNDTQIEKLYTSINYISRTLREDCPQSFFEKYTNSVIEHLSFSLIKKEYKTVNEYVAIRLKTGGMYLLIDLIEYVHSVYLTKELIDNNNLTIEKLQEQCALIGALSNDIFSYAKEKHSDYNLINAYIITKEASSYTEAVAKSINRVNDVHADYMLTMKNARSKSESLSFNEKLMIDTYFDALDVVVASSYHWQKITNRYFHIENVFEDMKIQA